MGPCKGARQAFEGQWFFSEWDEKALWQILNEQRDTIKDLKKKQWQKALPQILVIIDDFADRSDDFAFYKRKALRMQHMAFESEANGHQPRRARQFSSSWCVEA